MNLDINQAFRGTIRKEEINLAEFINNFYPSEIAISIFTKIKTLLDDFHFDMYEIVDMEYNTEIEWISVYFKFVIDDEINNRLLDNLLINEYCSNEAFHLIIEEYSNQVLYSNNYISYINEYWWNLA